MPIDIRNINEITFTQSFRGYNTEEVDDFLDDIYDEAVKNNKEIEELKKRITELESGALAAPIEQEGGASQEEAYAIIANAQQEADNIIDAARKKAHALIESAEKMAAQKLSSTAPAQAAAPAAVSSDTLDKLKAVLSDSYKKQMQILSGLAAMPANQPNTPEPVSNKAQPVQKAPETPKNDVPSVSFSGITREHKPHIPAERDILGEINSIGLDAYKPPVQRQEETPERPSIELKEPEYEPIEEESSGLAFSFGDDAEEDTKEFTPVNTQPKEPNMPEPQPEDPDDIIAQILRDNNRN